MIKVDFIQQLDEMTAYALASLMGIAEDHDAWVKQEFEKSDAECTFYIRGVKDSAAIVNQLNKSLNGDEDPNNMDPDEVQVVVSIIPGE